jgi:hypothetical protein
MHLEKRVRHGNREVAFGRPRHFHRARAEEQEQRCEDPEPEIRHRRRPVPGLLRHRISWPGRRTGCCSIARRHPAIPLSGVSPPVNRASLAQLQRALDATGGTANPGAALVLGAGGSRLAYDLHMEFSLSQTFALDFNPLLLLIARKVTSGDKLVLHEFPTAPVSLDDHVVERSQQDR